MSETNTATLRAAQIDMQPEFFRTVLDMLPTPVFYKDRQGRYVGCNRAYESFFGIQSSDLAGKTVYDIASKDLADIYAAKDRELFDAPGTQVYESQVKDARGMVHDVIFNKSTFLNSAGNVVGLVGVILDVTARKTAEQLVKDSEQQYRTIFEALYDIYYRVALDGTIQLISPSVYDRAGYRPEELIGRNVMELYAEPAERAALVAQLSSLHEVNDYEIKLVKKTGEIRQVALSSRMVVDEYGKLAGIEGMVRDIEMRKRAEQTMRENEDRFHRLVDELPEYVFVYRGDKIQYVNQTALRILGYTADQIFSRSMKDFVAARDLAVVADNMGKRARGLPVPRYEVHIIDAKGNERCVLASADPITFQGEPALLAVLYDITTQQQAEAVLRESQERYNQLVNNTETGFVMLDERGIVVEANEPYRRLVGAEAMDQVAGHSVIEWTAPEERENNARAVRSCEEQGHIRDFETIYLRQDGTRVNVLINAIVQDTPHGKRIVSFLRDITKRKLAEAALRRSEKNLSEILNSLDGLVYVTDMKTYETLFVNKYGKETWGDFTGKTCWQNLQTGQKGPCSFCTNDRLLNPDDTPAGVCVWEFQNTITSKWYECRDSAILWPDGRMVRLEIATDITERKRAEQLLNESEEKYRMLVEHQGEGIVIADLDELITYSNPAAEQVFGVAAGTLTGRKVTEFVPAAAAEKLAQETGRRRHGEQSKYELEIVRPSGVARTLLVTGVPQTSSKGSVTGTLAILQDITEQKRAQEVVRISEEKYRSLFANMLNGFAYHRIITDEAGRPVDYVFLEVNNAFERMTGLTSGDIIGKRMTEVMPDLKHDPFDWVGTYGRVALEGMEFKAEQYSPALGKWFFITAYSPAKGFFVTVFDDITERKRDRQLQDSLYLISELTTSANTLDELYAGIHESVEKLMPATNFYITIRDERSGLMSFPYHVDQYDPLPAPRPMGNGLTEHVLRKGVLLLKNRETEAELTATDIIGHPATSWLGVPLREKGRTFGAMVIQEYDAPAGYGQREADILSFVSDHVAAAIIRKRNETELRKLSIAMEQSANVVVITDLDATIVYVNKAFVDLTGYSREEAIGKNPRILKSGDMDQSGYKQMWQVLLSGEKWSGEFHNKKKNGDLYWEQATITSIKDELGKPIYYLAIKEDITMRRGLEEERERLIGELQDSLDNIKTLKGLVPICSSCKKIRDDKGYWQQVEEYVSKNTEAEFSHGLCDECAHKLYPEYFPDKKNQES